MNELRPFALTIAGHDPSGGAGITADVKAFEVHKVIGFSVNTGLTFQNEKEFKAINWVESEDILFQIDMLFQRHLIDHVKIGLIENLEVLNQVVDLLLDYNPSVKIIWDPILSASAGFQFHDAIKREELFMVCEKVHLITPNIPEIESLMKRDAYEGAKELSQFCNVLLKGGHNNDDEVKDILFMENGSVELAGQRSKYLKHGTGCVLSASITANLANGKDLESSCKDAKEYIKRFIESNDSLLGWHLN